VEVGEGVGGLDLAFWSEDGERIILLGREFDGTTRLFEIGPDRQTRAIGPPSAAFGSFSHAGGVFLGTECLFGRAGGPLARGVHVYTIDLSSPEEWRSVAEGCAATLSPDGRSVAFSADARTMWRVPSDGSAEPELLFDVADVEGLTPADLDQALIDGPPTWGEAGLAFSLVIGDRVAVGIREENGRLTAQSLGDNGVGFTPSLAWQPGGSLLAATNASHAEGIMRVLDTQASTWRVVALANDPFMGLVWSPDGEALLAGSRSSWVIVDPDPDGGRLDTVVASRAWPMDWTA
jgi:hypothetical protein